MPTNRKVASLEKVHTFVVADFEVFKETLENVAKVLGKDMDTRGFDQGSKGFDHINGV
jgi:hypothetical protein